jgi:hypothetical protein
LKPRILELEEVQDQLDRHVIMKQPEPREFCQFLSNSHLSNCRWSKQDKEFHLLTLSKCQIADYRSELGNRQLD